MKKGPIEEGLTWDQEHDDAIFKSQKHFKQEISRLCYGDLYVIGRLWIQALRKVLVGADFSLIPVVHAAKPFFEKTPSKPPKMKYKDLPIYESPHYEYKDYMEDKKKCPKANIKILHTYLYPKVKSYRQSWATSIRDFNKDAKELIDDGCKVLYQKKDDLKCYLRSDDNLLVRQAVLATGVASGFYVGRGAGVLKRIFCTTVGGLATGAVVFPKETDKNFRGVCCMIDHVAIDLFNRICGMHYQLRKGCQVELPIKPPPRTPDQKNKCEQGKPVPVKKEPAKPVVVKKEPAKAAAGKKEPAKAAAGKKEPEKAAAGKKEPEKAAAGKKESEKAAPGKKEPEKAAAGKKESEKAAAGKKEPEKAAAEKKEPPKK